MRSSISHRNGHGFPRTKANSPGLRKIGKNFRNFWGPVSICPNGKAIRPNKGCSRESGSITFRKVAESGIRPNRHDRPNKALGSPEWASVVARLG